MGARRAPALPGIATMLLWASMANAGGAAAVDERHNQSDSVAAPHGDSGADVKSAADPLRAPAVAGLAFQIDGESWSVFQDPVSEVHMILRLAEKLYFHNHAKSTSTWGDPRVAMWARERAVLTPKERRLRLSVAVVPLVVFLIAMSARLVYLQKFYPELLWPTKERRARKKYRNKEKTPRQRFKVSQDGKGGRSANS